MGKAGWPLLDLCSTFPFRIVKTPDPVQLTGLMLIRPTSKLNEVYLEI